MLLLECSQRVNALQAVGVFSVLCFVFLITKYPGPLLARASSFWCSSAARKLRKAQAIQQAHEQYGPIVRIALNELSFTNPSVLKTIYGHGLGLPKTDFYQSGRFIPVDNLFSMRIQQQHTSRKAIEAKAFSQANIWGYESLVGEKIGQMLDQFAARSEGGTKPMNIHRWLHWFTLDVIFHFTLNHESGSLRTGERHPVVHDMEVFQASFAWYAKQSVQRERHSEKRAGFIARLIENPDSWLGRHLNDLEVAEELMAFVFGGSGTTANTLVFMIWSVLRDARIHAKLTAELREAMPNPREVTSITAANKLPYSNAVIMETLRRFPTIPGTQPRYVDKELVLDGHRISVGTSVGVQNFSLHRNPSVFPDPEAFIPERWLAPDTSAQHAAFNGFGAGPRACIGRNIAMMELQLLVPCFFRRFNAKIADTMKEADMVMTDGFSGGPAGRKLDLYLPENLD